MWQVVTASHLQGGHQWLQDFSEVQQEMTSDIDDLISALAELMPCPSGLVVRPAQSLKKDPMPVSASAAARNLLYFPPQNALPINSEVIEVLEIPRAANAPTEPPLSPALREQLLNLRTTVLLAAEQRQLRSVLICSANPAESSAALAAHLSKLLAEYERLKIAFIEVKEEEQPAPNNRKVLPFGYSFQIRQTKKANLSEIASSLGAVRLNDWLKWWRPKVVVQEMGKLFDLVVISAPPITTHSDVALLAGAVDGVILAATEHVTAYADLAEAQQRLHAAQANILGVMLHQAPSATTTFSAVKSRVRNLLDAVVKSK